MPALNAHKHAFVVKPGPLFNKFAMRAQAFRRRKAAARIGCGDRVNLGKRYLIDDGACGRQFRKSFGESSDHMIVHVAKHIGFWNCDPQPAHIARLQWQRRLTRKNSIKRCAATNAATNRADGIKRGGQRKRARLRHASRCWFVAHNPVEGGWNAARSASVGP